MNTTHPTHTSTKPTPLRALCLLLFVLALVAPFSAAAQDTPTPDATAEKKSNSVGFKAAGDNIPKENLPGWPFLYGAYAMLWFLPLAYVVFLWKKQQGLNDRIAELDKRLDRLDQAAEQTQKLNA